MHFIKLSLKAAVENTKNLRMELKDWGAQPFTLAGSTCLGIWELCIEGPLCPFDLTHGEWIERLRNGKMKSHCLQCGRKAATGTFSGVIIKFPVKFKGVSPYQRKFETQCSERGKKTFSFD